MAESESHLQKLGLFFDVIAKVCAIGAATLGLIINSANQDIEHKLKAVEASQAKLKFGHDSLSFEREFKFKIYQLAIDAIKSKDPVTLQVSFAVQMASICALKS